MSWTISFAIALILPCQVSLAVRPVGRFMTQPVECNQILAQMGYRDFLVKGKEGRDALDETLKAIALELRGNALSPVEREIRREELTRYLFPLFVRTAMRRYPSARALAPDDLFDCAQDAIRKLILKIEDGTWDPKHRNRFFTYAYTYLKNRIGEKLNSAEFRYRPEQLHKDVEEVEPVSAELEPMFRIVEKRFKTLSTWQQNILVLRAQGLSLEAIAKRFTHSRGRILPEEIGDDVPYSKERIRQIEEGALRKLGMTADGLSVATENPDAFENVAHFGDAEILLLLKVFKDELKPRDSTLTGR